MRSILLAGLLGLAACAAPMALGQTPRPNAPLAAKGTDVAMEELELVWAKPDGLELSATVYRPRQTAAGARLPVLVDVHGGAWGSGDRTGDALYCRELAKGGLVVVSIDFRQSPKFRHPAASADVAAAVRFVRANAATLKADPARIGLIGSSSGGHLALLAALRPDAPQHRGTPVSDGKGGFAPRDDLPAHVDYVVAMWPVSDPAARYRYARRAGLDRLVQLTDLYFADEAARWDASIPRIATSGEAQRLPPILVVHPGEDSNIPQEMTFDLLRAWQARGGRLDYVFYPGQPHAFGHKPSEATSDLIETIAAYIRRQTARPAG